MRLTLAIAIAATLTYSAAAQEKKDYSTSSIVTKMMAFNKKHDDKLTKDEVTDERLHRLFDMADANKDGIVTKDELMALAAKLEAEQPPGGGRGPSGPGGGPADGPGGRGPGGPGVPGGRGPGGPPQPGQVLPPFLVEQLKLTDDQKKKLDELQKDVEAKLAKILTDDQRKQLKEMAENPGRGGPGGHGGPGRGGDRGPGRGGPGGPGGRGGPGGDRPPPE